MKFLKLKLVYNGEEKNVDFSEGFNLVYSYENSVGKSTLLRLLFFSMGYGVPSTKGINFTKVHCELILEKNGKYIKIIRNDKLLLISDDGVNQEFNLPENAEEAHAFIFGSDNYAVVNNIIGSIYLDQEKGWTLVNNGIVIGKIRFNLRQLIGGLDNRDVIEKEEELSAVSKELKKYQSMESLYEYKTELMEIKDNGMSNDDYIDELERELSILEFDINKYKKQINDMDNSLKENREFINYIENMKIFVKFEDKKVPVNKDNISGYESAKKMIEARKQILSYRKRKLEEKTEKIRKKIQKETKLVNIDTELQRFNNQIVDISINPIILNKIIEKLKKDKKKLSEDIYNIATKNNNVIDDMYCILRKYAKELGIFNNIEDSREFLFTSDLKGYSGAIYHKLVFIFNISYIIEIEKYLGMKLPIVLDSPRGREVDKKMLKKL